MSTRFWKPLANLKSLGRGVVPSMSVRAPQHLFRSHGLRYFTSTPPWPLDPLPESERPKAPVEKDWYVDTEYEVPQWRRARPAHEKPGTHDAAEDGAELGSWSVETCKALLETEGAHTVSVVDVRKKADWCQWMIIGEMAGGSRQVISVGESLLRRLKRYRKRVETGAEGMSGEILELPGKAGYGELVLQGREEQDPQWVLLDTGDIMVHLMTPEANRLYDLQGLWEGLAEDPDFSDVEASERAAKIQKAFEAAAKPSGRARMPKCHETPLKWNHFLKGREVLGIVDEPSFRHE
ncbi:hypothetical protein BJ684DRAFT_14713 [Piptocephalis cylindrospora]|uniref:Oligomerization domain-containing protein n=1 Tax=Piptocephalis cylindrospora TaxID=1907219 RepID=A0A4V1IYL8_9FUNG|nr:hypothetical protein BJ684DRAFT_14713 [Piptocephalis cylindrospora]|eukprot:RKP15009.1 hypothetical protein BJ684DRAFT_14713 [Piptocephalis cylindrospora]